MPESFDNPLNREYGPESDMPEGSVQEFALWQSVVDQTTGKESAYRDPDGQTHRLGPGEKFEVRRDRIHNWYEALIIQPGGTERILRAGPMLPGQPYLMQENQLVEAIKEQQKTEKIAQGRIVIDYDRLQEIYRQAKPGALFGREVTLSDTDKENIEMMADAVEHHLEGAYGKEWGEFEKLAAELQSNGLDLSSKFPPSWLVRDETNGPVRLGQKNVAYENDGQQKNIDCTVILVPDWIYRMYYWKELSRQLRDDLAQRKDTSAAGFKDRLGKLESFLKQVGKL